MSTELGHKFTAIALRARAILVTDKKESKRLESEAARYEYLSDLHRSFLYDIIGKYVRRTD